MDKDWMPKGGVKELQASVSGRKYLAKLQKKHELDLLQPGDPKFDKVYGAKVRRDAKMHERQQKLSRDEWGQLEQKKAYEAAKQKDPGYKKYF